MYKYEICNIYDRKIFYKQDKALVKNIRGLKELSYLEDVDGSQIKSYELKNKGKILYFHRTISYHKYIQTKQSRRGKEHAATKLQINR